MICSNFDVSTSTGKQLCWESTMRRIKSNLRTTFLEKKSCGEASLIGSNVAQSYYHSKQNWCCEASLPRSNDAKNQSLRISSFESQLCCKSFPQLVIASLYDGIAYDETSKILEGSLKMPRTETVFRSSLYLRLKLSWLRLRRLLIVS